jgi:indolepyruvate ferredoxin oxidoreductase
LLGTKKRQFGSWLRALFPLLAKLKFVRGTPFDPFGYLAERKAERWMIEHFEGVVDELVTGLTRQNLPIAERIVRLPGKVAGFGHIKSAAAALMLEQEQPLLAEFREPPAPIAIFDPARVAKRSANQAPANRAKDWNAA